MVRNGADQLYLTVEEVNFPFGFIYMSDESIPRAFQFRKHS